jgi:hypothetical protein
VRPESCEAREEVRRAGGQQTRASGWKEDGILSPLHSF